MSRESPPTQLVKDLTMDTELSATATYSVVPKRTADSELVSTSPDKKFKVTTEARLCTAKWEGGARN
jgi:hypothetical protein